MGLDILGLDILGLDIMGLEILGLDILGHFQREKERDVCVCLKETLTEIQYERDWRGYVCKRERNTQTERETNTLRERERERVQK